MHVYKYAWKYGSKHDTNTNVEWERNELFKITQYNEGAQF